MEIVPQILRGQVMHKRLLPRVNGFTYGIYYLCLPLSAQAVYSDGWRFGMDRAALTSFFRCDHGDRSGGDLQAWAQNILASEGVTDIGQIMLLAMPRTFGHAFNPVSFWLCFSVKDKGLRAVICEVNNTFGETHSYVCLPEQGTVIGADDWLQAKKVFHVSPFLPRDGGYKFRFSIRDNQVGIWIDYYDAARNKQLLTALTGKLEPLNRNNLRRAFWAHPAVALVALARIHWHALRLCLKHIKYIPKPVQLKSKTSRTER